MPANLLKRRFLNPRQLPLVKSAQPSATASKPSNDGRCFWDKLPAGIKDIIFEMAYVPQVPIKPTPKWRVQQIERKACEKEGREYWPNRVQTIVDQRFLVSREWCSASLKIFYSHAELYFANNNTLHGFLFDLIGDESPWLYTPLISSITVQVSREVDEGYGEVHRVLKNDVDLEDLRLQHCDELKNLPVLCEPEALVTNDYDGTENDFLSAADSEFTEELFGLVPGVRNLVDMCGGAQIRVVPMSQGSTELLYRWPGSSCECHQILLCLYEELLMTDDFKLLNNTLQPAERKRVRKEERAR